MTETYFSAEALVDSPFRKSAEGIARYSGKLHANEARQNIPSIISRNAAYVFGRRLAERATSELRELRVLSGANVLKGEDALRRVYAPIIGAIAIGLGWGEETPSFQLLSADLYKHIIAGRISKEEDGPKKVELETLYGALDGALLAFTIEKRIDPVQEEEGLLLRKLYSGEVVRSTHIYCMDMLNKRKRSELFAYLRSRG